MSIVALTVVVLTLAASLGVAAASWYAIANQGNEPQSPAGAGGLRFEA